MFVFYVLISLIFVAIWGNYFKQIEVIQKERLPLLFLSFLLGVFIFVPFYYVGKLFPEQYCDCGFVYNHMINSIVNHGLLSEIMKLLPLYLLYLLFRKDIKEPISIFLFFTTTALGFSFSENISNAIETGKYFVSERTFLTYLNEMFCSAIVSYAVINYRFYSQKISDIFVVLIISAVLSGFFDFWVFYERLNSFGILVTIVYFMLMVSVFAHVLTSSINISSDFSYLKIASKKKIVNKFNRFYLLMIFIQFLVYSFFLNIFDAFTNMYTTLWFSGVILFVVSLRVSKIRLIENRWGIPKIELPFNFYYSEEFNGRKPKLKLKFRGETFNESAIDFYLGEVASINPLSKRNSFILSSKNAEVKEKLFLKNDEVFYHIEILNDEKHSTMLLKPKTSGKLFVKRRHAIAALMSIPEDIEDFKSKKNTHHNFIFREWVFVKYR